MVLFGIEGPKQTLYVFYGASQNNLCRCGGCGSEASHVILEDSKHCVVALQRGCGLPSGARSCNNYCTSLPPTKRFSSCTKQE